MSALMTPRAAKGEQRGPLLARWRLHEPVRFYLWLALGLLVVGLNVAGVALGEWPPFAVSSAAMLAVLLPAIRAARASVYSAPGVIREMARVRAGA